MDGVKHDEDSSIINIIDLRQRDADSENDTDIEINTDAENICGVKFKYNDVSETEDNKRITTPIDEELRKQLEFYNVSRFWFK